MAIKHGKRGTQNKRRRGKPLAKGGLTKKNNKEKRGEHPARYRPFPGRVGEGGYRRNMASHRKEKGGNRKRSIVQG